MADMTPAEAFSLILRLIVVVTPIDGTNGCHMPFLLIVHLVMHFRNLAFEHNEQQTAALAAYLSTSMQSSGIDAMGSFLCAALKVTDGTLDVVRRVVVRISLLPLGDATWTALSGDGSTVGIFIDWWARVSMHEKDGYAHAWTYITRLLLLSCGCLVSRVVVKAHPQPASVPYPGHDA